MYLKLLLKTIINLKLAIHKLYILCCVIFIKQKRPEKSGLLSKLYSIFYFFEKASITSLLTPIFENPPSLYKFCKVTFFVKSLNMATV